MDVSFKFQGLNEISRALKAVDEESKKQLREIVRKSTLQGEKKAKILVPVDSGASKEAIHSTFEKDGMVGTVSAAQPTKEDQKRARSIEFGRRDAGAGKGVTDPQPYIRPASILVVKSANARIKRALNKIAKAWYGR